MSEVREFFRHCPACGKRFHIKLVGEKLMNERRDTEHVEQGMASPIPMGYGASPMGAMGSMGMVVVEENVPLVIDVKDFQYTYKCKHCGHVWAEMHEREDRA